jgi:ribose 1,5-bisphosphate isomerase
MRNVLNHLFFELRPTADMLQQVDKRYLAIKQHFDKSEEDISRIGSKKISSGDVVFTHCHSSTVVDILKKAKKEGKRFKVYNTETRPLFQGRITARELARAGIPVVHFIDSAARIALKEADIMLIGADAISSEGKVFNKIGSEMFAEIAHRYDIPVYVCTDSWKFDPQSVFGYEEEIEKRAAKEVWPAAPKGVLIDNRVFEKIASDLVAGIISELGVYKPEVFIEEVKRTYPWMF